MRIEPTAATRIVATVLAPTGSPAAFRIAGLTTMMYAIARKVLAPASTSVRNINGIMPGMKNDQWNDVDAYIEETIVGSDDALQAALDTSVAEGLPAIAVSPAQGKFLNLIARLIHARSVLEI